MKQTKKGKILTLDFPEPISSPRSSRMPFLQRNGLKRTLANETDKKKKKNTHPHFQDPFCSLAIPTKLKKKEEWFAIMIFILHDYII
jgi:hypothetical protein